MMNRTFNSIVWTGIDRFGTQVFQAVFAIILARLLMPEDYGLIAMIFIFLVIGQALMDGGLSLALVQKKNPTEEDFSTVFWFNIVFGLFFYGVFFLCAPLIAKFYEQPQLIPIIKIAGLNFIVWSFGIVHSTKLNINLEFKKHAFITISAILVSGGFGIVLAYLGYGVWALVFQFLTNNALKSLLVWLFGTRWFPKILFKFNSLKSLFAFGSAWILSTLLDVVYKNIYAVFIGKRYSAGELGLFQQGYNLSNLATTNVAYTINSSFIPLQSKLHDYPDEQQKLFFRFLSLSCFVIFPIATLFVVLAEPFVSFILTSRWLLAVPFLQILCVSYLVYPILLINSRILLAKGLSKQFLKIEIIKKAFGFTAFFICLPHGIFWICASIGFYTFFSTILSIICSQKILSIRWTEQLKIIFPMLGLAVFSGIIAFGIIFGVTYYIQINDFVKLVLGGFSGIGVYLLGSYWLKLDELKFALDFLKRQKT
jgi:O-antigen/teichoic acid export membrane protein